MIFGEKLSHGISIALVIHSFDRYSPQLIPRWGFGVGWLGVAIHLSRRSGTLKGWCAVRTLQEMLGDARPTNVQSRA